MKTLHLLRHAKSSWSRTGQADRERGLRGRGKRDAVLMGAALAENLHPLSISVSPARRAQLTLDGLCQGWPALGGLRHCTDESLYTFSGEELLRVIANHGNDKGHLFVIAHNPALTDVVNHLAVDSVLDNLPTSGYIQLSLDIDSWGQVLDCVAVINYRLFPKQLK